MSSLKEGADFRWLSEYEKTWEGIGDDADSFNQATIDEMIHKAKRKMMVNRKGHIKLSMIRHLLVVIDMSRAMLDSDPLKPTRIQCVAKLMETFITEFFDQNTISQLGIVVTRDKRAEMLTRLTGNPKMHIAAIHEALKKEKFGCSGDPSIQNSLNIASSTLRHLPSHASREVLFLSGSLTTCDPSNIFDTITELKNQKIQCSVISLSAEVQICKKLCKDTDGQYNVILSEQHFKDLLLGHVRPPESADETGQDASLIRMGFPVHKSNPYPAQCSCQVCLKNKDMKPAGFFCPQCQSKYCGLPIECLICGLTLVSAPHLARSYQHLFPLPAFKEVELEIEVDVDASTNGHCAGCQKPMEGKFKYECMKCHNAFCNYCDLLIHETLHGCPGCTSSSAIQQMIMEVDETES